MYSSQLCRDALYLRVSFISAPLNADCTRLSSHVQPCMHAYASCRRKPMHTAIINTSSNASSFTMAHPPHWQPVAKNFGVAFVCELLTASPHTSPHLPHPTASHCGWLPPRRQWQPVAAHGGGAGGSLLPLKHPGVRGRAQALRCRSARRVWPRGRLEHAGACHGRPLCCAGAVFVLVATCWRQVACVVFRCSMQHKASILTSSLVIQQGRKQSMWCLCT